MFFFHSLPLSSLSVSFYSILFYLASFLFILYSVYFLHRPILHLTLSFSSFLDSVRRRFETEDEPSFCAIWKTTSDAVLHRRWPSSSSQTICPEFVCCFSLGNSKNVVESKSLLMRYSHQCCYYFSFKRGYT